MSPPLAVFEPAEMTEADWEEVVSGMDADDAAKERRVRSREVTETDLGVPLDRAKEVRTRLRKAKDKSDTTKPKRRKRQPKDPWEGLPCAPEDTRRFHFRNVIGMSGTWYGPVEGCPCFGCGGATLPTDTICARCDASGLDFVIGRPTAVEAKPEARRYAPTPGVKGGVG